MRNIGLRPRPSGLVICVTAAIALTSISLVAQKPAVAPAQGSAVAGKPLGIGRAATQDEIAKLDIDVRPDGKGLPEGKGSVAEGAKISYELKLDPRKARKSEAMTHDVQ